MLIKNISSVLFASLLAAVVSLLLQSLTVLVTAHWGYSILYFALLCFVFNLIYAAQAGSESFSQLLLGGIVAKLLLALIIVFLYSVFLRAGFLHFAIHFISHYVLFTITEIRYLSQLIKSNTNANI